MSKLVCIRHRRHLGNKAGTPTREGRLLDGWQEIELHNGSADDLLARLEAAEAERQAEAEAAREQVREASRARQPKRCGPALSKVDQMKLRADPELMEMAKSEPPISEVCKPVWMTNPPEFFLSELFADDDLVSVLHAYGGGSVERFSEIKDRLNTYSGFGINPLARGEAPKRKRIAVNLGVGNWKQLSFLTRSGEMQLLVCGASGGLYGLFGCENWPQEKLKEFATLAIRLGGELVESVPMPGAPGASLNGSVYEFLYRGGFVRDQQQYKPRNFTVYWQPPAK